MGSPRRTSATIQELSEDLRRFEDELIEANLRPVSVETYIGRSEFFFGGWRGSTSREARMLDGSVACGPLTTNLESLCRAVAGSSSLLRVDCSALQFQVPKQGLIRAETGIPWSM